MMNDSSTSVSGLRNKIRSSVLCEAIQNWMRQPPYPVLPSRNENCIETVAISMDGQSSASGTSAMGRSIGPSNDLCTFLGHTDILSVSGIADETTLIWDLTLAKKLTSQSDDYFFCYHPPKTWSSHSRSGKTTVISRRTAILPR